VERQSDENLGARARLIEDEDLFEFGAVGAKHALVKAVVCPSPNIGNSDPFGRQRLVNFLQKLRREQVLRNRLRSEAVQNNHIVTDFVTLDKIPGVLQVDSETLAFHKAAKLARHSEHIGINFHDIHSRVLKNRMKQKWKRAAPQTKDQNPLWILHKCKTLHQHLGIR